MWFECNCRSADELIVLKHPLCYRVHEIRGGEAIWHKPCRVLHSDFNCIEHRIDLMDRVGKLAMGMLGRFFPDLVGSHSDKDRTCQRKDDRRYDDNAHGKSARKGILEFSSVLHHRVPPVNLS